VNVRVDIKAIPAKKTISNTIGSSNVKIYFDNLLKVSTEVFNVELFR